MGKNGKSTKHRKTRDFLALPGGRRQGRRPLSPTERRELPYGNATARGPWPDLRADAPRRLRRISRPSISSQCGLESFGWGPASEIYSLCFLKKVHGKSWQGFFPKNCCQFQLVTSCTGASVQRLLCVKAFVCNSFCM